MDFIVDNVFFYRFDIPKCLLSNNGTLFVDVGVW